MRSRALDLLRAGICDGAIGFYREIALRTPADARSHYDLAAALSFLRRFEEASGPIRSAIRLEPDNVQAQEMASLIFLNLRWHEEAFEATLTTARLGEPTAIYGLVSMHEEGIGVQADPDQAPHWAMQAAEHGHLGPWCSWRRSTATGVSAEVSTMPKPTPGPNPASGTSTDEVTD